MRIVKVVAVKEEDLERIEKNLIVTKDQLPIDSPMNAMLNESLTKLLQAKKINRIDQQKYQDSYRYVVDSMEKLAGADKISGEISSDDRSWTPDRQRKTVLYYHRSRSQR